MSDPTPNGDLLSHLSHYKSRLFDFYIKYYKIVTVLVTIILLCVILALGWYSGSEITNVVVENFNHQQLLLAQHASGQIEGNMNIIRKQLKLLSLSPSIQYSEDIFLGRRMNITFSIIDDEGGQEIRYVEYTGSRASVTHVANDRGHKDTRSSEDDKKYLLWASDVRNRDEMYLTGVIHVQPEPGQPNLIMKMALPVWQTSVDQAHPRATGKFSGVLIVVVDVTELIEKTTGSIRSGKTGYAWVIDSEGTFLYHPERQFVGKNAFEARTEREASISYARINNIQKEMMLTGREGTTWYISGWHRGKEGEMKKLIAFSPAHVSSDGKGQLWSVAVVAPMSEVEGSVRDMQTRQLLLEGAGIIVTLLAGVFLVSLLLRWSHTVKKEVEAKTKELIRSEHQYRSLVENANDIIFTISIEGKLLSMNRYGYNFFGRKPEAILNKDVDKLFPADSAEKLVQTGSEIFETPISKRITCKVRIDDSERWLNISMSGLLDEWGNVYKVLGIGRDITERKKMDEQMIYTEKLASMGTLAAGVAHEINNPLAVILGFTDLLLDKTAADTETYDVLKTIEKQGLNAKRVVENLLSFARHSEHKEEDVDINQNIEEVLAVIGHTLMLNRVTTIKDFAWSPPPVKGEPREFQQVFFNLINNAIAVMKGGGVLTLCTREVDNGRSVEVRVSDTGTGIKKEHRTKVFDPLFTTKKVGEGTGLGLSVTYGIVTNHGGTITFETKTKEESDAPGTTFIVKLPAVRTEPVKQPGRDSARQYIQIYRDPKDKH